MDKKKYKVTMTTTQSYAPGCGPENSKPETKEEYTWAVSTKQAISNIKRRYGIRAADQLFHGQYGYCRRITFAAEMV